MARRTNDDSDDSGASSFVPDTMSLSELANAADGCRGCSLWSGATQTVFGEGRRATFMLVGEQPDDQEDRRGRPFVGPAGRVLWGCVDDAGTDRDDIYVTNAVKHFKYEQRGTRRIQKKPDTSEVVACHPWIDAEIRQALVTDLRLARAWADVTPPAATR